MVSQNLSLNILAEDVATFSELAKEFPAKHRPHTCTLWRWHKKGLNGVKLEAVRIGNSIVSSKQALNRFLQATQN